MRIPAWASYGVGGVGLAVAVIAALLRDRGGDSLLLSVETLSAVAGNPLQRIGDAGPAAYAFAAGMVAAINPCGFAMLPGYLALYLRGGDGGGSAVIPRAAAISGTVAASFMVLFGLMGLALSAAGSLLAPVLPFIALATGVLLVFSGARLLTGSTLYFGVTERLAGQLVVHQKRAGLSGYAAYGVAYGLMSVSCTLPVFLSVVGTSLLGAGFGARVLQFVLYGAGMGFVLSVATALVAVLRTPRFASAHKLRRWVGPLSAVALLLVGSYIVYYWLTLGL